MWRRRESGEDGAIALMAAFMIIALLAGSAVAVDVGRLTVVSRDQQGMTDRAALDAVVALRQSDPDPVVQRQAASTAALGSLGANMALGRVALSDGPIGLDEPRLRVGRWDPDARELDTAADPTSFDAVEVWTASDVTSLFLGGSSAVARVAVAWDPEPVGVFSVGSSLLSLSTEGSLLGDVLAGTVCPLVELGLGGDCSVFLEVGSWQGLVGAQISLGELLTGLDLDVGQPGQILQAEVVALGDLLQVAAAALDDQGSPVTADLLNILALRIPTSVTIPLGDLLEIGLSQPGAALDVMIDLDQLVSGGLLAGNIRLADGDGLLAIDGLSLNVAGLAGLEASLQVLEAPRIAIGPVGTQARSAQVRVGLRVGVDLLGLAGVELPLALDVAPVTATLTDIACPGEDELSFGVTAGLAQAAIGSDPSTNAWTDLVSVGLTVPPLGPTVTVGLQARGRITAERTVASPLDVPVGEQRNGPSAGLNLSGLLGGSTLQVRADPNTLFGIGELLNPLLAPLLTTLTGGLGAVLAPVENYLLGPLLGALGVGVSHSEIEAIEARCGGRRLVQ